MTAAIRFLIVVFGYALISCSHQSFPLKLGDNLSKAEEVLGELRPSVQVIFPGLSIEDVKNLIPQNTTSTFLGNKRYGVFIGLTSKNKIWFIRVNREYAELDITSPLYGILPTDNVEKIKRKLGEPTKVEDHDGEYTSYFFKSGEILIEVDILLRKNPSYNRVKPGELITFAVSRSL